MPVSTRTGMILNNTLTDRLASAEVIAALGGAGGVASFNVTTGYNVNAVKVVGAQGAAVADATDAASVLTQLNAVLARLRAHGLIAP